jgi:hypothetical protein
MERKTGTLADIFAEYEAKAIAEANSPAVLAKEEARWQERIAKLCDVCGKPAILECECPEPEEEPEEEPEDDDEDTDPEDE